MGRIEEVVDPAKALEDAAKLKDAGNSAFKEQRWEDALECYSKALGLVPEDSKDRAVLLKNRAATHLKLEGYEDAVSLQNWGDEANYTFENIKTIRGRPR